MSAKEKAWLAAYLGKARFNATEAARIAGYAHPNVQGPRKKKKFADEIEERLKQKALDANQVLALLSEQAISSVGDFIDDFGNIRWDKVKEQGHLVRRVTHQKGELSSIEIHNQQSALDKLAKAHGLYRQQLEVSGEVEVRSIKDELVAAIEREMEDANATEEN